MAAETQFKKGVSGNPGGRTKAHREVARYIRDKTMDGKELADILLTIARNAEAEDRVRLLAVEALLDRGIGKPVQAVDLRVDGEIAVNEQPRDWSLIPIEERRGLLEAANRMGALIEAPTSDDTEH